jgi:hypothetical protein
MIKSFSSYFVVWILSLTSTSFGSGDNNHLQWGGGRGCVFVGKQGLLSPLAQ